MNNEIVDSSAETIPVDLMTVRHTIANIARLLRAPHSPAAQSMARLSAKTLTGYLPETLEEARKTLASSGTASDLP